MVSDAVRIGDLVSVKDDWKILVCVGFFSSILAMSVPIAIILPPKENTDFLAVNFPGNTRFDSFPSAFDPLDSFKIMPKIPS